MTTPLVVLNGPTASGKSSLAIRLCERLGSDGRPAEIINADSMLVYRGMDIGTAKPTPEERSRIRHHLIDIADVSWHASVADFQQLARAAIADCRDRGVTPVLVGGSALYVHAIVDVFEFPGTDPDVRAGWESRLEQIGAHGLHAELRAVAPEQAQQLEPGNGRRIVRALEIHELTGGVTTQLPRWQYHLDDVHQFGLSLDRVELDRRIELRVQQMWTDGLVDEVRQLAAHGLREGITASRAIGYRQVLAFLDGTLSEDEARRAVAAATRRFSRKQASWFRRDPRIEWLEVIDDHRIVDRIVDRLC